MEEPERGREQERDVPFGDHLRASCQSYVAGLVRRLRPLPRRVASVTRRLLAGLPLLPALRATGGVGAYAGVPLDLPLELRLRPRVLLEDAGVSCLERREATGVLLHLERFLVAGSLRRGDLLLHLVNRVEGTDDVRLEAGDARAA
jgi:hypothetical protein